MDDGVWRHGEVCWPRSNSIRNYDRFESYSAAGARSRAPIWRALWRKMKRGKKRMFSSCSNSSAVPVKLNYDPCSYSQNFDDQSSMWDDADEISSSFSARFGVSARFFEKNHGLIV